MWSETTITEYARTLVDDSTPAEAKGTLELDTDDSVEFADLTLNTPSNIYALSHDSFADFVANEHIDHSGVTITAGTGLSGGGTIDGNVTLNCDITQYTDELAQDAIGGILDNGTVGNVVFTYDDETPAISAVVQEAEIDHDALNNTHNLTTDIDHDQLTNFTADEHFTQAGITTVGTVATGTWEATDVGISHGGTGQSTAQAAIDALTAVGAATNEHVLTKDTDTGNAIWKVAAGGGTGDTFTSRGDPAAWDWSVGNFTTNGLWQNLDLSGIIAEGSKRVEFRYAIGDGSSLEFYLRKNGNSNAVNIDAATTLHATMPTRGTFRVDCDSNRQIQYWATNASWNVINLVVSGWWT